MTDFGRTLWLYMQDRTGGEINRTELAEMLSDVGFEVDPANVSAWMNGDRMPPPGLPYYSALALDLDDEKRCELAWAYLRTYKDRIKGRGGKKGPDADKARDIERQRSSEVEGASQEERRDARDRRA